MISASQIEEIIEQYEKHGWSLRRVLLSATKQKTLSAAVFGNAQIFPAELDALWFSRGGGEEGRETWELRALSGAPFALLEVFEADDEEEIREAARCELQTRLLAQASKFVGKSGAG